VTGATSQDHAVLNASTDQLILERLGTLDFLQEIAAQKSVPVLAKRCSMPVERDLYRLDGLNNGVCRFLSDEQRSCMHTRCWGFLDEEDDVVGFI
jgi:hypothetical protein